MSDRFFLDTNIFVYSCDAGPKGRRATELIREAVSTRRGIISFQVVQEFFNLAFRRFAQPMSVAEAEQYLSTVFRPLLAVHSSPALYMEALRLHGSHTLSWYDSLIAAAGIQSECEVLYTEDLQNHRKLEGLRIQNPFA